MIKVLNALNGNHRAPLFEVQTDDWECFCAVLWDPAHADCAVPQVISSSSFVCLWVCTASSFVFHLILGFYSIIHLLCSKFSSSCWVCLYSRDTAD